MLLVALAAMVAIVAPGESRTAARRAEPTVKKRYVLTFDVKIVRFSICCLNEKEVVELTQESTWTGGSRSPFWIYRSTSAAKPKPGYRFKANIAGQMLDHQGKGKTYLRIVECEAWIPTTDIAPPSTQRFAGTFTSLGMAKEKLSSGKTQDRIRLAFSRRQPVMEPTLDQDLAKTSCSPATTAPSPFPLPFPPSWVYGAAAAKIKFGRPFTLKFDFGQQNIPSLHLVAGGVVQDTQVSWILRFRPSTAG